MSLSITTLRQEQQKQKVEIDSALTNYMMSLVTILFSRLSEFYNLSAKDIKGNLIQLNQLKGQTVLIVNVASQCGFTKQYEGLQNLYEKYKDKGFTILGFPCNQFRRQEPGSNEQIMDFVSNKYGVTFPIMSKVNVNGNQTDSVFAYLKSMKSGPLGIQSIEWNFEKFLIDKNGNVVQRYSSLAEPKDIEPDIKTII
ncbi:hypothetical protein RI543_001205 [Arxiozyma heterogenica]|uniref:Glutathione peroxidase n=1 Tax=Arxiozyma heterogenica TaxID=278026 RepID=A0AAN7ZT07_9SACH|nr:hypothetical protein RI543_001205 [Kazachstania heterogenica]